MSGRTNSKFLGSSSGPSHANGNGNSQKRYDKDRQRPKRPKAPAPKMPEYFKIEMPSLEGVSLTRFAPHLEVLDESPPMPQESIYDKISFEYFKMGQFKSHPRLSQASNLNTLIHAVNKVYSRRNILFCFDVEAFELNSQTVTEIGISIYDPRAQQFAMFPDIKQIHIIIKECAHLVNGRFVANNKDNFLGGPSLVMSAREAIIFLQILINYYFIEPKNGINTVLVGHNVKGDISWFSSLGLNFPVDCQTIDTETLWSASAGKSHSALGRILRFMNLPHAYLHNAGNDAYYTLLLAMNLSDPNIRMIHNLDSFRPIQDDSTEKVEVGQENAPIPKEKKPKDNRRRKGKGFEVCEPLTVASAREAVDTIFNA